MRTVKLNKAVWAGKKARFAAGEVIAEDKLPAGLADQLLANGGAADLTAALAETAADIDKASGKGARAKPGEKPAA